MRDIVHSWQEAFGQAYAWDAWLVCLLTFSFFWPPYWCVAPALLMLVRILATPRILKGVWQTPGSKAVVAFIALEILITLVQATARLSLYISLGLGVVMFLSLYLRFCMTPVLLDKCVTILCLGGGVTALFGLTEQLLHWHEITFRASSMFFNPNYFALVMAFVAFCTVIKLAQGKQTAFYLVILLLSFLGILVSDSRAALIVAFLGVLLALALLRQWRLILVITVLVCLLVPVAMVAFPQFFVRLQGVSVVMDFDRRMLIWKASLQGFLQSPLWGQGVWRFSEICAPLYDLYEIHSHNLFLEILLSTGVAGTTLLAGYILTGMRDLVRMYRVPMVAYYAAPGLCALFVVLLHGIVDVAILFPQTGLLFLLLFGGVGIYDKLPKEQKAAFGKKRLRLLTPHPEVKP